MDVEEGMGMGGCDGIPLACMRDHASRSRSLKAKPSSFLELEEMDLAELAIPGRVYDENSRNGGNLER
jgi:hypothetical protein